ncbi:hypothetical protein BpHYR1_038577 [Brachionus plicatilis]|uniref:Uncharacterized protein n=1 Tax=Brachionus plicatilis TaxID=10195 RepID=A0A3M7T917_BRAPC|nr:hypothetical protein BpHYR1_038577 [Brachionus plicatilis]
MPVCHSCLSFLIFQKRQNVIELNKEDLFSTFGYLAIYIGGNGLCHRINSIRKEKINVEMKRSIKSSSFNYIDTLVHRHNSIIANHEIVLWRLNFY